jgi:pyoverdine/dityrosine biosynthesis protein Dit1
MYYIQVENKNIIGKGQVKCLNEEVENIEVSKDVYYNLDRYMYQDGQIVENPNYEEEQAQKERERIALLSLTRGDVFRGLLQAKGVTRAQLRAMIETNEALTEVQKEMALIDFDEALNFYRGNALIDTVGFALGITSGQLDKFFETNDYKNLVEE